VNHLRATLLCLGSPKQTPPPIPLPPPLPPQLSSKDVQAAGASYAAGTAAQRGLAGTILTGPQGTGSATAAGKALTGQ
jgi:hypothetical protein